MWQVILTSYKKWAAEGYSNKVRQSSFTKMLYLMDKFSSKVLINYSLLWVSQHKGDECFSISGLRR